METVQDSDGRIEYLARAFLWDFVGETASCTTGRDRRMWEGCHVWTLYRRHLCCGAALLLSTCARAGGGAHVRAVCRGAPPGASGGPCGHPCAIRGGVVYMRGGGRGVGGGCPAETVRGGPAVDAAAYLDAAPLPY